MINEQLKKIGSIKIDSAQDSSEYKFFIKALKDKFIKVMEQTQNHLDGDFEYTSKVSWIALKGWKEEYNNKSEEWWITNFLKEHAQDNENEFNKEISLRYCEMDVKTSENINRAYDILKLVWPEAYEQVNRLVLNIYIVDDESDSNFYSTTAPYWFGGVFIKKNNYWNSINYLDTLLHESGHLSLMIKQSYSRMLNNLNDKAQSPLRKDPRWLNGILHAAFALWRICEGLKRSLDHSNLLNDSEKKTATTLFNKYSKDLDEAIKTLQENGDFTEFGEIFFLQIVNSHSLMLEESKWLV